MCAETAKHHVGPGGWEQTVKGLVSQAREHSKQGKPQRILDQEQHVIRKRIWQLRVEGFGSQRWGDKLGDDYNCYYRKITVCKYQIGKAPKI